MSAKTQFQIAPLFYIALAVSLLLIPLKWVIAWFTAIGVHELFHYIALMICGLPVKKVEVRHFGVQMDTFPMSGWKEATCAAAGPCGSLLLVMLSSMFPRLALCGAFHCLFNLLPIYPLDGSRILHGCIGNFRLGNLFLKMFETVALFALILLCLWSNLKLATGPIPLILCLLLMIRRFKIKIPCKDGNLAVQ